MRGTITAGELPSRVGQELEPSSWLEISQERVDPSTIRARAWSFAESVPVDAGLLQRRIETAVQRREPMAADSSSLRLVFGEADGLPGLIVDRYAGQLVTQFQSAGTDAWREALISGLLEATGCGNVFDRSDGATRAREGLPEISGVLRGDEPPERIEVIEHGLRFLVDVRRGHKTGYYIDQPDNRRAVRTLVERHAARAGRGPRCLNCFCYTGGFSIAMLAGGAEHVHSIDSSADALRLGADHVALNGLQAGRARWEEADVFTALRALKAEGAQFDVIVLDPRRSSPRSPGALPSSPPIASRPQLGSWRRCRSPGGWHRQ